jgi:hypothetical protein
LGTEAIDDEPLQRTEKDFSACCVPVREVIVI